MNLLTFKNIFKDMFSLVWKVEDPELDPWDQIITDPDPKHGFFTAYVGTTQV